MAISDYDSTAGNNTSISGINIAEACAPANINNAIRQLMADLASQIGDNWTLADSDTIQFIDTNPKFSVALSSADQSVTADTWTTVVFDNELEDNQSTIASGVFTAPVTGTYLFGANITYRSDVTTPTLMEAAISRNDETPLNYRKRALAGAALSSTSSSVLIITPIRLTASNTARCKVRFSTSAAKVAATNTSYFWGHLIA